MGSLDESVNLSRVLDLVNLLQVFVWLLGDGLGVHNGSQVGVDGLLFSTNLAVSF